MAFPPRLLELVQVSKNFDSTSGPASLEVLKEINLQVELGQSLAITGPSGSGKSTLLHIMGTLDRPTNGRVMLQGKDLSQLNDLDLAVTRNRLIGFVFQAHYLLPQCTVLENVLVPTLASNDTQVRDGAQTRAERLLERVGLGRRLAHRPAQLSGGEKQRVAVVRALINRPILLLADEPTGALDRLASQNLGQLLVEINREENVTLILATHSQELEQRFDWRMELQEGKLS